ncbi:MAG: rubredoxin-like domain-containing protein [Desulfovibrionaceae bacterium]
MDRIEGPLAGAFIAQSIWAARCEVFAHKAVLEGREGEAKMFRAMARAGQVHAHKALLLLRGTVGGTGDNLAECIQNRRGLVQALPDAVEEAGGSGDKAATAVLCQMLDAARSHSDCLRDMDTGLVAAYHVCSICGYVAENTLPVRCPVCDAVSEKFETVD